MSPHARQRVDERRPWPIVVLSFCGALLATLPLLVVLGMVLGDFILKGPGSYAAACVLGGLGIAWLRRQGPGQFMEHLAVVGLLIAQAVLVFALIRDLGTASGAALAACATLATGLAVRSGWVTAALGASAAGLVAVSAVVLNDFRMLSGWFPLVPVAMAAAWLAALQARDLLARPEGHPDLAPALEHLASGWLAVTLLWLALSAGMSFLAAGLFAGFGTRIGDTGRAAHWAGWPHLGTLASVAGALCSAFWAARRWAVARSPLALGLAAALAVLSGLMPPLGVAVAVGVVALVTHRWWQAAAAGLSAAWIVGALYYSLQWPLSAKALVMAGAGALLGGLAWGVRPGRTVASGPPPGRSTALPWALLGVLATLSVVNVGIWQKETLIARGERLYLRLGPVDPRSLMQGDYMALDLFEGSPVARDPRLHDTTQRMRPRVAATVDDDGVATMQRVLAAGEAAAAGERVFELTPKAGRWVLVTDAWHFREGEAAWWARARFGELRVDDQGRALLVGLADAQRRPIRPPPPTARAALTPASPLPSE